MRNIDKFSLMSGSIGLIADTISLGGLLLLSDTSQKPTAFIWFLVFVSIIYTVAFINFFTRKFFDNRNQKRFSLSIQQIESEYRSRSQLGSQKSTQRQETAREQARLAEFMAERATYLITYFLGIPILSFYLMTVHESIDFIDWLYYIVLLVPSDPFSAFLVSCFLSFGICTIIHLLGIEIYRALEPSYKPK